MSESVVLEEVEVGIRLDSNTFKRNIFVHKSDIPKYRKKYKNKGVYVSAYQYMDASNKTEESLLYGDLYIDLDNPDMKDASKEDEAFEKIREDGIKAISFLSAIMGVNEDMIRIYYSGQKGIHIIVPAIIFGIQPIKELNFIFKMIASDIQKMSKHKTIDTGIYDNARLLLLPGGKHPNTGRYKTPLTYQEFRTLSFQEIKNLSKSKRKVQYKKPMYSTKANRMFRSYIEDWKKEKKKQFEKSKEKKKATLDFCPPCIKKILHQPCPEGFRNRTAAALSSYFRQRGYSEEKAWKKLSKWNDEFAKLNIRELSTTFNSVYHREYVYGCATLMELGDCDIKKCKIGQHKLRKA